MIYALYEFVNNNLRTPGSLGRLRTQFSAEKQLPLCVAEFQFRYNNRENGDIFGAVIGMSKRLLDCLSSAPRVLRIYLVLLVSLISLPAMSLAPSYQACQTEYQQKEAEDFATLSEDFFGWSFRFISCEIAVVDENEGFVIGLFTAILAASTILLWKETRNLAGRAEKQEGISRDQTEQLRRANEHAEKTERAYVMMRADPPGLPPHNGRKWRPIIRVRNFGRTPAKITDAPMWHKILRKGEQLPLPLTYDEDRRTPKDFLVANEDFYFFHPIQFDQSVEDGTKTLWLYGHVDYIDFAGVRHRSGWARKYKPDRNAPSLRIDNDWGTNITVNLVYVTEEGYNYDRCREPGEGNDWD